MKAIVLLNGAAGTIAAWDRSRGDSAVAEALAAAGIDAEIRLIPGADLQSAATIALSSNIDVLIVGGGDGTLSTVAGVLADQRVPLGILPLGTLNHFAKDLGIPLDLGAAAKVIAANHVMQIDVGELNGRVFVNNSSLGIYPYMVRDRDAQRKRHGFSKWVAMLYAMLKVFRRFPLVEVKLTTDTASSLRKTPLVFVGNNRYQLDLFNLGTRACLDRGELSLYVANAQSRWGMFKLIVRAMCGSLQQARDFETLCLTNCTIGARRHHLHVAADGEVLGLKPPLHYCIRPGALRVCVPRTTAHTLTGTDELPDSPIVEQMP
ncbi:MAG: sphingosine kinase [Planctomycetaceae bacterium]|nr:sphingosine kinase [Planctomycetaceae bacterium]